MRILLVEDDVELGSNLQAGLGKHGYIADWLTDGGSAKFALEKESFDLVLLDLGLPKILGLDLLQQTRDAGNNVPVIIITARDSLADKVECFDCGADDFLTKPFELEELCARINACCKRAADRATSMLRVGNIKLNPAAHKVWLNDERINLPRREFALLEALMQQSGRTVSRETLMQRVYGWEKNTDSNALEVHIHNLRKKLKTDRIFTVRGIGYRMEEEADEAVAV